MDWGRNGVKMRHKLTDEKRTLAAFHIRKYKDYKEELEKIKLDMIPSPVASYKPREGISGDVAKRTTEEVTMRIESAVHVRCMEQTVAAVESVLSALDEIDLRLVDLIYWQRRYTITGAGLEVGLTKSPTYARINNILWAVLVALGHEKP